MSSSRLGPPSRAPSCHDSGTTPARSGPDIMLTTLPMIARSSTSQARILSWVCCAGSGGCASAIVTAGAVIAAAVVAGDALTEPVQLDVQPNKILQGRRIQISWSRPGPLPHHMLSLWLSCAFSHAPAVTAARRYLRPTWRPGGAQPARTFLFSAPSRPPAPSGPPSEICAQALTGCPARSGSSPAATRGCQRLVQRIVVPTLLSAVIFSPGLGLQRIQHCPHDRRALRAQVPITPHPLQPGLQLHRPVPELCRRPRRRDPGAGTARRSPRPARQAARSIPNRVTQHYLIGAPPGSPADSLSVQPQVVQA